MFGFGMWVLEILAQRIRISTGCHAHSYGHNAKITQSDRQACGA